MEEKKKKSAKPKRHRSAPRFGSGTFVSDGPDPMQTMPIDPTLQKLVLVPDAKTVLARLPEAGAFARGFNACRAEVLRLNGMKVSQP